MSAGRGVVAARAWPVPVWLLALLLVGCSGKGAAIGITEDYIIGGHIEAVRDTLAGVVCYHDAQSNALSCVRVKP